MTRLFAIVLLTTLAGAGAGCHPGLGERCNPALFSDECTAGDSTLSCVYPPNCGVAYCCPTADKTGSSSNPNCMACPTMDMGTSD
jgi:hypothetical protein